MNDSMNAFIARMRQWLLKRCIGKQPIIANVAFRGEVVVVTDGGLLSIGVSVEGGGYTRIVRQKA